MKPTWLGGSTTSIPDRVMSKAVRAVHIHHGMELTQTAVIRLPVDLSAASVAGLTQDFEYALASPASVVVVAGADADTFCLGLAPNADASEDVPAHPFADLLASLHRAPKPMLAIVDGRAIGGGLGLACACDWVIATERATFALPELSWGLLPAIVWPVLTDRMAPHAVRQWTISAHTRSAVDAEATGLVDTLVSSETIDPAIQRAVRHLRRLDGPALRSMRMWARYSRQMDLQSALTAGAEITATMLRDPAVRRRWSASVEEEAPW